MSKFKVGDYVIFTDPEINHYEWPKRREDKIVGKVTEVTTRGGMPDLVQVDYPGWEGTTSAEDQLEHAFRPGTKVVGKHRYSGNTYTGTVAADLQSLNLGDNPFVRVRTPAGTIKHLSVNEIKIVKLPGEVLAEREDAEAARRGDMHTLSEFPAKAKVVKYVGGASRSRHYLHRVGQGQDLWELSHSPDNVDGAYMGRKSGADARFTWFNDKIGDFEIVSEYDEEEEISMTETKPEREFIGKAPETEGPKYQTPFRAEDNEVRDRTGKVVAEIDLEHDYEIGEDRLMAEAIATALNEKFDGTPTAVTGLVEVSPVKPLRTLFKKNSAGEYKKAGTYPFVYEVSPGQFWGGFSRESAVADAEGLGWNADEDDGLYDVNDPDGPIVVS